MLAVSDHTLIPHVIEHVIQPCTPCKRLDLEGLHMVFYFILSALFFKWSQLLPKKLNKMMLLLSTAFGWHLAQSLELSPVQQNEWFQSPVTADPPAGDSGSVPPWGISCFHRSAELLLGSLSISWQILLHNMYSQSLLLIYHSGTI